MVRCPMTQRPLSSSGWRVLNIAVRGSLFGALAALIALTLRGNQTNVVGFLFTVGLLINFFYENRLSKKSPSKLQGIWIAIGGVVAYIFFFILVGWLTSVMLGFTVVSV